MCWGRGTSDGFHGAEMLFTDDTSDIRFAASDLEPFGVLSRIRSHMPSVLSLAQQCKQTCLICDLQEMPRDAAHWVKVRILVGRAGTNFALYEAYRRE